MKKLVKFAAVLAALTLSLGFMSCDQNAPETPATGNESTDNGTNTGNTDNTDADDTDADDTDDAGTTLTKTSLLGGLQAGDDVWGSGTKITKNDADNTYTVEGAGVGVGTWGGKIAAIPVCFGVGDLTGFTHIVLEADISGFTLNDEDPDYPSIELKLTKKSGDNEESKVISATSLFKDGKAEIPVADVEILNDVQQLIVTFRGLGTVVLKDISKAK